MDNKKNRTTNCILNITVIFSISIFIFSTLFTIGAAESVIEPMVISESNEKQQVIWDFGNIDNYTLNNTVIEDGIVELKKVSSTWRQENASDFDEGNTNNITITDDGNLGLSVESDDKVIDIDTAKDTVFKINHKYAGYQTFRPVGTIMISKLTFLAEIDGAGLENLNVSIETMNDEILDHDSIPSSQFQNETNMITINLSYGLEANTTYRIVFKSEAHGGSYYLIGDSSSVYSDSNFVNVELNDENKNNNETQEDPGVGPNNIDFEIYAVKYSTLGTFESEVYNAGFKVFWKELNWQSIRSLDDYMEIEVRSSNSVDTNDKSWSTWTNVPKNNGEGETSGVEFIVAPSTCFQYRIIFSTTNQYQTQEFNWINISYDRYCIAGSIETSDFEPLDYKCWSSFNAVADSRGQVIDFYYSLDSGKLWHPLHEKSTLNLNSQISQIRFIIKFRTNNTIITPGLDSITLEFTPYDPNPSKDDNIPSSPPSDPEPKLLPPGTIAIAGISVGLISLLGYGLGTETGKYSFLKGMLFFIIPLYHKVDRDKILDHYLRNQIYKYIQTNPGTHYSEIMKDTGVKNGVLVHHLNTLDRERLIKSIRDGMFRRFYPTGMKIPQKEIENLSWFQIRIFNYIRTHPGTSPLNIANEVGKSKQVINYHLKLMRNSKLVRAMNQGKQTKLYISYNEPDDHY